MTTATPPSVAATIDETTPPDHDATPEVRHRYQRMRLWCGIAGIGLILVSLWASLALGVPAWLDGLLAWSPHAVVTGALAGLIVGLAAAVLQLPLDLAAMRVEVRFGQRVGLPLGDHLRRAAESLLGVTVAGGVLGAAVWVAGLLGVGFLWWLLAAAGLLVLAFVHVAYPLRPAPAADEPREAWVEATRRELATLGHEWPRVGWYDHGERSLAGGWNGVGPARRLFLATSLAEIEPRIAAGLIAREVGHLRLGHRVQSVGATVLWVTLGLAMTAVLFDGLGVAGLVLATAAVMSTWCWLGLFVWPALGRHQILAADAFAKRSGLTDEEAQAMLQTLAERNLPDESLPPAVAYVFHPIPPMADRRRALSELA